jgi:spore photoproduct lyase
MKKFQHIYIEESILEHPNTKKILDKFPEAIKIEISNYKRIFNKSNQDFLLQKNNLKLILAKKIDNFLYKGSSNSNDFGNENFYYNTLILNCIYDCEYCFLQGMFNSANIVLFVNTEDFFKETKKFLERESLYLCLSYETDLLAFEDIYPYTREWIEFANKNPNLKIEIRTKSNYFDRIADLTPSENIILAWTLSPSYVIKTHEHKTPRLNTRLKNIKKAIELGWNVRICFDPILPVENWKTHYSEMIMICDDSIDWNRLFDISIGTFRINRDYLKKMKKLRTNSPLLYYPFEQNETISQIPSSKKREMIALLSNLLLEKIQKNKLFIS